MSEQSIPPDLIPYLLGEKKDFSSVQGSIVTINVIFISLICVTTGLRFWVRFGMLRAAGPDDMLMIVAFIFAMLLSASCLVGHSFGLGKHIWNLSPVLIELPAATGRITKALYGAYLAYATAITFTKFSIIATYFRILVPKGMLRKVILAITAIVMCFWICSIFAVIFTCVPIRAAWDYSVKGKCFPIVNFLYVSSAFTISTDLLLCFLPLPTLWALKMPVVQRIVLCVLFSGGTFACVASILRLTQLHHLGAIDITYQSVGSLNWSVVEVGTAIICSSLSALRPLAPRTLPKLFHHFPHSSGRTPNHSSSQPTSKLSTLSSVKIVSDHTHVPTSKFSLAWREKGDREGMRKASDGNIVVERTFDITELKELPPVTKAVLMSSVQVLKRVSSRNDIGMFTDTARLFEKSSEDLFEPTSPKETGSLSSS